MRTSSFMPSRGLRLRVAVTFALGGLALSATLAVLTYVLGDRYLTDQRERSAVRQAYIFARFVREEVRGGATDAEALAALEVPAGGGVLLHRGAQWSSTSEGLGSDDVPVELRRAAAEGEPAHQRVRVDGAPSMVVALPVSEVDADFFMTFPLVELASTLGVLRDTLLGVAGATTLAAAFVGALSAGRVLLPLGHVGRAARRIAAGDLEARLDVGDDPDLRGLTDSFNTMAQALQQRLERDARFASDVSHELRSPLMTLSSAVSVLERRRDELPERSQQALELLADEVRRFEQLLTDLLELARAEAGQDVAHIEVVDAGQMIDHALGQAGVTDATVDGLVANATVTTDKRRLDRILTNLIANAQSHGGGVTRVGVTHLDGILRIEVDDRGPGIPMDQRAGVFERFARGSVAGRRGDDGGTGLGLALVGEHVRILGGRVWIEDATPVPGARFVVELPSVVP